MLHVLERNLQVSDNRVIPPRTVKRAICLLLHGKHRPPGQDTHGECKGRGQCHNFLLNLFIDFTCCFQQAANKPDHYAHINDLKPGG